MNHVFKPHIEPIKRTTLTAQEKEDDFVSYNLQYR